MSATGAVATEPRILPAAEPRVETGTVQFGDDWPGLFIRGDNCFWYAQCLAYALAELNTHTGAYADSPHIGALKGLHKALRATRVKPRGV